MKKIYFLAAIALVAGVSCTKQVPVTTQNSQKVSIAFTPLAQNAGTKANPGEQTATYSLANGSGRYESFKAWSVYSDAALTNPTGGVEFFSNITCDPNITNAAPQYWKMATKYYWPKSGYLSFHAFSPSDVSGLSHTWGRGFILTDYTVNSDAASQIDLLYSDYTFNKRHYTGGDDFTSSSGTIDAYDDDDDADGHIYDGVDIKFNHALASIAFKVCIDDAAYTSQGHKFTVTKVQVLYPYQSGTFYENRSTSGIANAYGDATTPDPALTASQEQIINVWAAASNNPYWAVAKTELQPTDTNSDGIFDANTYVAFSGSQLVTETKAGTPHDVKTNAILAMPQSLVHDAAAPNNHTVSVQVCYDYQYNSGTTYHLKTTVPLYATGLAGTDASEAAIADVNKWLINHKYIYTLNFKLDEIIFDPAVRDFVTVTVNVIDLPEMDS